MKLYPKGQVDDVHAELPKEFNALFDAGVEPPSEKWKERQAGRFQEEEVGF